MSKLNLAQYLECTEVEGPGKRFALWVQGCMRHCPGCCNPQFWDFIPKTILDSKEICAKIQQSFTENAIEGVTFLGGEPMLQAKGLSEIAAFCRERALSVMVFTGYTLEELKKGDILFTEQLLSFTDLLVEGPYNQELPETRRNWVGSTNQRFHFLTDFYQKGIEYDERFSHGFELRINTDGNIITNGFPW